jgi:HK97 family phage prohead protease
MRRELPQLGKLYRTALVPEVRAVNDEARTIDFVASTEAVDRYGDVIRVAGWKFEAYKKNPVFLWAHKSGEPPIGKTVSIHVETSPVPTLVQKVEFADAATYKFADTIFNLYKGGFLKAVSVGFMPLEMPKRITDSEGNQTGGYEFTNQELLELSAVPVPANPEALARAVQKGFPEVDLQRVFSGPNIDRELAEISIALSRLAVGIASATVRVALAELRAAGVRAESGELTFEELLSLVKQAGTSVGEVSSSATLSGEIDSIEKLADVLSTGDEQFERALGLGDDEPETSWNGSRKWRDPGRLTKE